MSAPNVPAVSVVATVLNEATGIRVLLDSLSAQARRPDQVVFVDGGSTDGTLQILQEYADRGDLNLVVLSRPGANISAGRNAGITVADGPTIACTDAGVRLEPEWLQCICAPLLEGVQVVGGWFEADPDGAFETALGAATLPSLEDIDPKHFLPSSRSVAFTKNAWSEAGGYPEWLDYCEDLVFDFRIIDVAGPARFAPKAVVLFRPRPSPMAFARQYYNYARGDGKADLWRRRHAVRYCVYLILAPALAGLSVFHSPAWLLAILAGLVLMLRRSYGRLIRLWSPLTFGGKLRAALWIPVVRVIGDVAKMVGYPVGLAWRRRTQPPEWRTTASEGKP